MRDIKFRAWNIRYKKMQVVERMWIPEDKPILGAHNDKFSIGTNWLNGEYELEFELMQYTGHKDKNGKEIYEGDICKCINCEDEEYLSKIEFDDGAFKIEVTGCDYDYTAIGWALNNDIQEIEVIGNIYENPKLLEVE